jgi:hypothetical protein
MRLNNVLLETSTTAVATVTVHTHAVLYLFCTVTVVLQLSVIGYDRLMSSCERARNRIIKLLFLLQCKSEIFRTVH